MCELFLTALKLIPTKVAESLLQPFITFTDIIMSNKESLPLLYQYLTENNTRSSFHYYTLFSRVMTNML